LALPRPPCRTERAWPSHLLSPVDLRPSAHVPVIAVVLVPSDSLVSRPRVPVPRICTSVCMQRKSSPPIHSFSTSLRIPLPTCSAPGTASPSVEGWVGGNTPNPGRRRAMVVAGRFRGLCGKLWPSPICSPAARSASSVARGRSACREERASPRQRSLAHWRMAVLPRACGPEPMVPSVRRSKVCFRWLFHPAQADVLIVAKISVLGGTSAFPKICQSVPQTLPEPRLLLTALRPPILQAQVRSNQSVCCCLISLGFHINPPVLQSHTRS
jgi:hypothetical protein